MSEMGPFTRHHGFERMQIGRHSQLRSPQKKNANWANFKEAVPGQEAIGWP